MMVQRVLKKKWVVYHCVSKRFYRDLPILWDVSLKHYSNNERKDAACSEYATILKEIMKDETREGTKNTTSSLQSNYRKLLKKVNYSRCSGITTDDFAIQIKMSDFQII
jgi:GTP cyclohydrolase I